MRMWSLRGRASGFKGSTFASGFQGSLSPAEYRKPHPGIVDPRDYKDIILGSDYIPDLPPLQSGGGVLLTDVLGTITYSRNYRDWKPYDRTLRSPNLGTQP